MAARECRTSGVERDTFARTAACLTAAYQLRAMPSAACLQAVLWAFCESLPVLQVLRWFEVPAMQIFHSINAWQEGSTIKLYTCYMTGVSIVADASVLTGCHCMVIEHSAVTAQLHADRLQKKAPCATA